MHRIHQNFLNLRFIIYRIFFMPGLKIEDPAKPSWKSASAAKYLAAGKPARENHIIRFRNVKKFTIHFFLRQFYHFRHTFVADVICMLGLGDIWKSPTVGGRVAFALVFWHFKHWYTCLCSGSTPWIGMNERNCSLGVVWYSGRLSGKAHSSSNQLLVFSRCVSLDDNFS